MLLVESSDIWNHHRSIQTVMTEAYTTQKNPAPIMETMVERKKHSI